MFKKLIYLSDNHVDQVQNDANEREISFTEMLRRILDRHYEHNYPTGPSDYDSSCLGTY